jgi:hypothetical protein
MKKYFKGIILIIAVILANFIWYNVQSKVTNELGVGVNNYTNNYCFNAADKVKNKENESEEQVLKERIKARKKLQVKNASKIEYPKDINEYKINALLNTKEKTLTGDESIIYINKTGKALKEIYFHIYPNAYQTKETTPAQFGFEKTFPNGFSRGGIELYDILVNNKKVDYEITGSDKSILKIKFNEKLKADSTAHIHMKFKVKIPNGKDRLGWFEDGYNFGNWYPIAAVYDEKGWHLEPYYSMGDPFYSDVSNYIVNISVPKEYNVASTGALLNENINNERRNFTFKELAVRDFAWIANNKFIVKEGKVDGIDLKCYSLSGDEKELEKQYEYAKNSLSTFNKYFGKYPYKTYSVVETNFLTGMEYPGIVFISFSDYFKTIGFYETIICHETAHQWWYGVVGSDEVNEAWLDESLASYSEYIYSEMVHNNTDRGKYRIKIINNKLSEIEKKQVILRPVNEFNEQEYSLLVYEKGAIMYNTIRDMVGDEKFFKILQTYYDRYKFSNAHTEDFINVVEEVTGKQWDDFFDEWLLAA